MCTTEKSKNALNYLSEMKEEDIDFSDIPELDFGKLGEPVVGRFYRPKK